ncbi:hypothetical protein [Pseudomonas fluorescens]|uniref:hypothetical protein n=1 Tax=Pseudomonas fluorescens TaxID=294 RepID=UPI001257D497|nr:hypothetical protein [Pseudomonas fluorescens]VVN78755.1 hypothetical protein PS720_00920 [Pseudomonas fluorescens]
MLESGTKIKHVKAANFINEMADSFNVAILQTASGSKISLTVGRDYLDIAQETLAPVTDGVGFSSQVLNSDVTLNRLTIANLSIPLEAAKAMIAALQAAVAQVEGDATPHNQPKTL